MTENWQTRTLGTEDAELAVVRAMATVSPHSKVTERTARRIGALAIRQGYKPSWSELGGWEVQLPLDTRETAVLTSSHSFSTMTGLPSGSTVVPT